MTEKNKIWKKKRVKYEGRQCIEAAYKRAGESNIAVWSSVTTCNGSCNFSCQPAYDAVVQLRHSIILLAIMLSFVVCRLSLPYACHWSCAVCATPPTSNARTLIFLQTHNHNHKETNDYYLCGYSIFISLAHIWRMHKYYIFIHIYEWTSVHCLRARRRNGRANKEPWI